MENGQSSSIEETSLDPGYTYSTHPRVENLPNIVASLRPWVFSTKLIIPHLLCSEGGGGDWYVGMYVCSAKDIECVTQVTGVNVMSWLWLYSHCNVGGIPLTLSDLLLPKYPKESPRLMCFRRNSSGCTV